jgi:beta-ribofuranosylaminobenzene 5'-phosphate synthase
MSSLACSVPSRIHITLYDMNGELGRIDGGLGFSINDPSFDFTITHSDTIKVLGNASDDELKGAIIKCIQRVRAAYATDLAVTVTVDKIPPSHSGFGSKTAVLLSIGQAYLQLHGQTADYRDLAALLGRGGTSGAGINLIDKGGLVLDGGHSTDEKQLFAPSSASSKTSPAPVLAHFKMPDWDVLVIQPKSGKVFGSQEVEFFKSICPTPSEDVSRLARIILSQILPSVVEARLDVFSHGINSIQTTFWKSQEIKLHGTEMLQLMQHIRNLGASAVGMSSFGPTLYALGNNLASVQQALLAPSDFAIDSCTLTKPNNTGIQFKHI